MPRALSAIRADIVVMHQMYQATRFAEEAERLPHLLDEANVVSQQSGSPDQQSALVALADTYLAAATLLCKVGEHDLAWVAADRALNFSERADDRLMMVACAYRLAHIFLRATRITEAESMVDQGLAVLGSRQAGTGPEWHSLRGSLFLTAAIAAARRDHRSGAMDALRSADVVDSGLGGVVFTELLLEVPYVKEYDVPGRGPLHWPESFDISNWGIIAAHVGERSVGGAVVAYDTPGLHLLGSRRDLAFLWDLRIQPDERRRGIGSQLFSAAEHWASERNCSELRVETQNVNVPASGFYQRMGCSLVGMNRFAYPEFPQEVQLIWSKGLG